MISPKGATQSRTMAPSHFEALHDLISHRHSVRMFLPTPVPERTLQKCFALAQLAPSNNNLQPWRATVITDEALVSLKARLDEAWTRGWPETSETPQDFMHHKENFGAELYGRLLAIGRDDHNKRNAALALNFQFYCAPAAIIVYMDDRLSKYDILSCGFWMQNLTLALRTHGIEACYMASVAGYPKLLKEELDVPAKSDILCGIAIGYMDKTYIGNKLIMKRDPWELSVGFKTE